MVPATVEPTPRKARPSLTRNASLRRVRHVQEALKGNTRSLRHGVFADVLNAPDVATEVALIYAARPMLDAIADRRLVELLAATNVQRQRCLIAMQSEGLSALLTAYDSRLAALVERLERAVHERERERATVAGQLPADLSRYLPRSDRGE